MIDHRRLQRTLLRMQLDGQFAARLLAGESAAVASTALGPAELGLLAAADPRAIAADRGDARRWQVLGNVAREFALSTAFAKVALEGARLLEDFASSAELHAALAGEGSLPLAFADYAERRAAQLADPGLVALTRLESSMARLRRLRREQTRPGPGELALSERAELVLLPAGTFEQAQALRAALDRAAADLPRAARSSAGDETVLILARPALNPHALPELHVEALSPAVASLLEAARTPLGPGARAALARKLDASTAALEGFADELIAEGTLVRG